MRLLKPIVGAAALLSLVLLQPANFGCGSCDLEITTSSLPDATVGQYYNVVLGSHCGGDDWFVVAGQLPPGIGLLQSGTLRGTPTQRGTYQFTLQLVDYGGGGEVASKGFALTVRNTTPSTPTAE